MNHRIITLPDDVALWLALSLIPGLGSQGLRALLTAFGPPASIYAMPMHQLARVVREPVAQAIVAGPDMEAVAPTLEWLTQPGNALITLADQGYPKMLLEIPDPPTLLYLKGRAELLNAPALAIVGSRNATPQGEKTAHAFARALSEHRYTIVSGMALGIDGAAHRGALEASGSTIAVVGTGLDIVYPSHHRELAHQISQQGLLVSEFSLGTPSRAQHFPRRNRIISGLARGCLVVEAHMESGSLITARLATEQGREVFAIPGSIHSPVSKGCHRLIKQGAKLVETIQDILEELGDTQAPTMPVSPVTASADTLFLDAMGYDPMTLEALLAHHPDMTSETLIAKLALLELDGLISSLPGGYYQRLPPH